MDRSNRRSGGIMRSVHPDRTSPDESSIRIFLIERVAEHCRISPGEVDPDRPLADLGLASRDLMTLVGELEELLGRSLPAVLVYEYSTIGRLAHALARRSAEQAPPAPGPAPAHIAVIGLGCR